MTRISVKSLRFWFGQGHLRIRMQDIDPLFVFIIVTATVLRFTRIGEFDNPYYTATVASMLQDPTNFLFASFDPLGLVMVDKPPLSFWIQGAFAAIFGLSVYVVTLPQVLAGIIGVVILYNTIRPTFGRAAARFSAATLAILPVSVVIDSRNEPDALVTIFTLLAATMLITAVRTGRLRWLLLSFLLLGMAFNTKMLVALIPLPAFILYYSTATRLSVKKWLFRLFGGLVILVVISASWITLVALTPGTQRPYVGSTPDDSIWTLVFDYNGIRRFTGFRSSPQQRTGLQGQLPPITLIGRGPQANPPRDTPSGMPFRIYQPGGGGLSVVNPLSLIRPPLGAQLGWLLPLGVAGLALIATLVLTRDVYEKPRYLIRQLRTQPGASEGLLWGTWLLTGIIVFGVSGATTTHPYYLVGLAIPLSAIIGITASSLFGHSRPGRRLSTSAVVITLGTLVFQILSIANSANPFLLILVGLVGLMSALVVTIGIFHNMHNQSFSRGAMAILMMLLLCLPVSEAINSGAKIVYGIGGPARGNQALFAPSNNLGLRSSDLAKLGIHDERGPGIATISARDAAPLIIQGFNAVAIGGFSGRDPILNVKSFLDFADAQKIGYFLSSRPRDQQRRDTFGQTEILRYVQTNWLDHSSVLGLPTGSLYAKPP